MALPRKRPRSDRLDLSLKPGRPRAVDLLDEPWGDEGWKPVSGPVYGATTCFFFYLVFLLASENAITGNSFLLMILHNVNLVFHEFGHPAFSIFGNTMGTLGGTIGQLLIPLVVVIAFRRQRDTLGFVIGCFWFFENFLDVAVYMADAIDLKLQLIGGLGMEAHDWRNLFLKWDVILQAKTIAAFTSGIGWVGLFWTWLWLGWRCLLSRKPGSM